MISLTAQTENHEAQLMFEQLAALFSWGMVAGDGSVISAGSGDWFVVRNSAGSYTVVFRLPKGGVPSVVVSPQTRVSFSVVAAIASFTTVLGAPADTAFSFIAMGT